MKKDTVSRFIKLSDGWVKDNLLGLDWGPSSDKKMTWEEAKKFCSGKGGRLPEIEELSRLIDYKRYNPAINPIFSDTKTDDRYWTNTQVAHWLVDAWVVGFGKGDLGDYSKDCGFYVRPVRPSRNK